MLMLWPKTWLLHAALPLLVAAIYYGSLSGGFVYDDWPMIADNEEHIGDLSAVPNYFVSGIWANSNLGGADIQQYRPIVLLWYFLVHAIAGIDPHLWRLANVALHAVNAVFLTFLVGRLYPQSTASLRVSAAAIFAAHPAIAHSVAWISGVPDLLLATIFMSAFLLYEHARASGQTAGFYGTLCCCGLAVLTKETGVVLPVLLLAYDLCTRARRKAPPLGWYLALLAVLVAYFGVRSAVLGGAIEGGEGATRLTAANLRRFVDYGVMYLRFLVFPWPLPLYVEHPGFTLSTPAGVALAGAAAGAMIWAAARGWQPRLGLIWIGLTIAPVLLLAFRDVGAFNMRYLYLPAIGLAIMISAGLSALRRRWTPGPYLPTFALATAFALTAHRESLWWKDQIAWSGKVIHDNPASAKGPWHLARYQLRLGDRPSAIRTYEQALKSQVDDRATLLFTEDLMELYVAEGRFEDTVRIYRSLSRLDGYEAIGYVGIGNGYAAMGRLERALEAYAQALALDPDSFDALYGHGRMSEMLGNRAQAVKSFERMVFVSRQLRLRPNEEQALGYARGFLARHKARP